MIKFVVRNDRMPLAIYREVATHLEQISGVVVETLPQLAQVFDYTQSQVGGLAIALSDLEGAQVDRILAYYGDRYGAWQREEMR